ncbi:hypothetical protein MKS88_001695 [Plasmodium brasilianum]|uniref:Uncharacterized protein n=1 Tax=Plasmodium brasilianum TaxID=5824 RepID=A0ACB9YDH4_PLABR|nr:hypothetical protein MKS88_001695 [Plasmodium brasilianum]
MDSSLERDYKKKKGHGIKHNLLNDFSIEEASLQDEQNYIDAQELNNNLTVISSKKVGSADISNIIQKDNSSSKTSTLAKPKLLKMQEQSGSNPQPEQLSSTIISDLECLVLAQGSKVVECNEEQEEEKEKLKAHSEEEAVRSESTTPKREPSEKVENSQKEQTQAQNNTLVEHEPKQIPYKSNNAQLEELITEQTKPISLLRYMSLKKSLSELQDKKGPQSGTLQETEKKANEALELVNENEQEEPLLQSTERKLVRKMHLEGKTTIPKQIIKIGKLDILELLNMAPEYGNYTPDREEELKEEIRKCRNKHKKEFKEVVEHTDIDLEEDEMK